LGGEANLRQAKAHLEKALANDIANFGEKAPTVAVSQSNLALVLQDLGGEANLRQAKAHLEKALANNIANFGEFSGGILITSCNLFDVCCNLEQMNEAAGIILKIYPISQEYFPDTHPLKGYIKDEYDRITIK
jgi:hypothetical protein